MSETTITNALFAVRTTADVNTAAETIMRAMPKNFKTGNTGLFTNGTTGLVAHPAVIHVWVEGQYIGSSELRQFKSGSWGYQVGAKVVMADGKRYQAQLLLTVKNTKPKTETDPKLTREEALARPASYVSSAQLVALD